MRKAAEFVSGNARKWLFFTVGGIGAGLASAAFAILSDHAQAIFALFAKNHAGLVWLVTPLGFALAAFLARTSFPNSQGSGIPQCIAAIRSHSDALRNRLLSFRVALGKVLLTLLGFLCGASIGREGPSVQVGASMMWGFRGALAKEHKALILGGSAAGIAAAFNAPLAGVVFAIEELSRSFESRTSGFILTATILAGAAAIVVSGESAYFGATTGTLTGAAPWAALALVSLAGGVLGALFSRFVIAMAFNARLRSLTRVAQNPVLFAAACGLVVALCGHLSGGASFGSGYGEAYDIIHHGKVEAWSFLPLKFIATAISSVSGIPGGLFSPSLSVGAGLGGLAAQFLPFGAENQMQFALIGMAAYLTGVVQSPITSVIIMVEMTDNNGMVLPLLAAALIANTVSRYICPVSIYHALAELYVPKDHKG